MTYICRMIGAVSRIILLNGTKIIREKRPALLQARRFYARWWNGCGELIQALWGCTIRPLETDTNTHTAAALSMRYNPGLFIDCGAVRRRVGKAFAKLLA